MTKPYYQDADVTLYLGDSREHVELLVGADAIVADTPYAETALEWDTWPEGWVEAMIPVARALWCFGSLRMFLERRDDFADWKFSHEIVWEKHNGSGFTTDKFRRVHEYATLWYRGPWADLRHEVPRIASGVPNKGNNHRRAQGAHTGTITGQAWSDDGMRLQKSVIYVPSMQQNALHPTQKPNAIVAPLIEYSVPPGGLVVDPFAGSGTTLEVAKLMGRRAIGVEAREDYCEIAANRLSQQTLDFAGLS